MGRIKTRQLKKKTREIFEPYEGVFTDNFEKNKEILKDLINQQKVVVQSKKLRNIIAGYLTRLKKKA